LLFQKLIPYDDAASLDSAFDFEATSYRLVVLHALAASFNVRFDFHTCPSPYGRYLLNGVAMLSASRLAIVAAHHVQAENEMENPSRGGKYFAHAKKPDSEPGFVFVAMRASMLASGARRWFQPLFRVLNARKYAKIYPAILSHYFGEPFGVNSLWPVDDCDLYHIATR
jgi:hypothetical protein